MTDEEKAEEKYQEHINKESCYISKSDEKIYTDGFLDGLAEGRKELEKELGWITDTDNYVSSKLARCFELEKRKRRTKPR